MLIAVVLAATASCSPASTADDDEATSPVECVDRAGERVCFQQVEEWAVVEGDIIIGRADDIRAGVGSAASGLHAQSFPNLGGGVWPRRRIYYVIEPGFSSTMEGAIGNAMYTWEAVSNFHFEPLVQEAKKPEPPGGLTNGNLNLLLPDHIVFRPNANTKGGGCFSPIGRTGGGQVIQLPPDNAVKCIVHEIGHSIGLQHEHNRPDRDTYVDIHLENVVSGLEYNFNKASREAFGPYDVESVMHYSSNVFAKNDKPTITRKGGGLISYKTIPSIQDAHGVERLYAGQ